MTDELDPKLIRSGCTTYHNFFDENEMKYFEN